MLGMRMRQARVARQLSLSQVAQRAEISVATLSRIERDKQGMELGMFLNLCKILNTPPQEVLGKENGDGAEPLAARIARLNSKERTRLWKDLSTSMVHKRPERPKTQQLSQEVDELLAQIDFLRQEIESVQKRLRTR